MEERDTESRNKSILIIDKFEGKFEKIIATFHPSTIPGEQVGKGSNEAWAFKQLVMDADQERQLNHGKWDLVHILDVDTHHKSEYYQVIEYKWAQLSKEDQDKAIFSATMHFNRNYDEVAWPVRIADMFWSISTLSRLYPGSNAITPMSSYSASVEFVKKIGGWDTDVFAIGEDVHFMVKSYFASNGDVVMVPIYVPGSSLHVDNGRVSTKGWIGDVHARIDQGIRHLWGALEFPYIIWQLIKRPGLLLKYRSWVVIAAISECSLFFSHNYAVAWLSLYGKYGVLHLISYTWINSLWMCLALLIYTLSIEKMWGRQYSKKEIIKNVVGICLFGPLFSFLFLLVPLINAQAHHLFSVEFRGWKVTTQSTKPAPVEIALPESCKNADKMSESTDDESPKN
eukprot:TRINITY_DN664_c0_g1_i13.p1 TRINITY_DN664_c0_g1~~TRINITY_DN664_c0_g1_i13.p1  ORF type:complete len:398 (-),score=51.97 TRINITY_DN664_c0_g1_i13:121-1314(-)